MMTRSQWMQMEAQEIGLIVNSTKAGHRVMDGRRRVQPGATQPTKSNPQGLRMVLLPSRPNPLLKVNSPRSSSQPVNNAIAMTKGDRRKLVPLTATFGDCLTHKAAVNGAE